MADPFTLLAPQAVAQIIRPLAAEIARRSWFGMIRWLRERTAARSLAQQALTWSPEKAVLCLPVVMCDESKDCVLLRRDGTASLYLRLRLFNFSPFPVTLLAFQSEWGSTLGVNTLVASGSEPIEGPLDKWLLSGANSDNLVVLPAQSHMVVSFKRPGRWNPTSERRPDAVRVWIRGRLMARGAWRVWECEIPVNAAVFCPVMWGE